VAETDIRAVGVFPTPTGDLSIFRFLAEQEGLHLKVLFSHPDRSGRGGAGQAGFEHRLLSGRALRSNRQTAVTQVWNRGLARELRGLRPDVLLVGGYGTLTGMRAIRWAGRHRVPWVLYSESWGVERGSKARRWVKRRILRRLLGRAAGFVTYGRRGEEYLRHFGASAPILVIGSNRDLESIARSADAARDSEPQAGRDRVFLFVGRLVEAKGVDVLLRAFQEAAPDLDGWRLRLAGDGPLRAEAELAARRLPIEVLGSVPFGHIAEEFGRADVLVLPSRHEPWGQVVPEAMAAGLPVLSSDAVGAADHFVQPGRTGWMVRAGDAAALAVGLRAAARADRHPMVVAVRAVAQRNDARVAAGQVAVLLRSAAKER
jgi:glycosyltransferase involved in cell wall biosynthesis